jgi:hypothetical protein
MAVGAWLANSEVTLTPRSVSALVPMGRARRCALWASGGSQRSLPTPPAGEPRPSYLANHRRAFGSFPNLR